MPSSDVVRISFKERMLQAREEAIVSAAGRLMAEKGFEAMTVDEVAAQVGIAKASLYKHFPGKEDLAAAAMLRVLRRAQAVVQAVPADAAPLDKLRAVARWALEAHLAGDMPTLPGPNSALRTALVRDKACRESLTDIGERLGAWIDAAGKSGALDPALPRAAVLYTLYARACDPAAGFLKAEGRYSDAQIIEWALGACFDGLRAR
ncbi:MAG: helix-turn-helix domain-containing protein [Burkholderiaceae bacterium]|nr:helix-turn-helix domain-containing protein [Burkholderiaceae bacterium]MDO9089984.1 helix-turn-helix domain-containing protein [Burkholderiaceae bacterium]MDP1968613.1 helix-turn-helix domain-containing protein [Burkholderiaceae bacterium]